MAALLGSAALAAGAPPAADATEPPATPPWMKSPGAGMSGYGSPAKFESTVTPSGLHFERHHSGVPEIDPARHRLLIHGLVKRPLVFSIVSWPVWPSPRRSWRFPARRAPSCAPS